MSATLMTSLRGLLFRREVLTLGQAINRHAVAAHSCRSRRSRLHGLLIDLNLRRLHPKNVVDGLLFLFCLAGPPRFKSELGLTAAVCVHRRLLLLDRLDMSEAVTLAETWLVATLAGRSVIRLVLPVA